MSSVAWFILCGIRDKDARYYAGSKPHNQATIINTNIIFSSFNSSVARDL